MGPIIHSISTLYSTKSKSLPPPYIVQIENYIISIYSLLIHNYMPKHMLVSYSGTIRGLRFLLGGRPSEDKPEEEQPEEEQPNDNSLNDEYNFIMEDEIGEL